MTTRSDRISVRLEAEELRMLRQLATAKGVSTSEALRTMIRETFARKRPALKDRSTKKTATTGGAKKTARRAPAPRRK